MSVSSLTEALPSRQNFHIKETESLGMRQQSAIAEDETTPWQADLLEMFLRNQLLVAPVMPLLSILLAITALQWVPLFTVATWLLGALGCHAIQLFLCNHYFKRSRSDVEQREWIGMMSASELMQGTFWVLPLFFFWPETNALQGAFLLAAIMVVSVVRFLVVSNFMPVLIAGTSIMTIGKCIDVRQR